MGALLQQLYAQVLGPRIGSVSITPLGTPNALMLIGRAENVKMAIELIQRLDQPIVPTARFEVFQLKHANAAEAKTLIDGFLGQTSERRRRDQPLRRDRVAQPVPPMPPPARRFRLSNLAP